MKSTIIDIHGADSHLLTTVNAWWVGHKMGLVPVGMLPRCGVLVTDDAARPLAVGWLFMDNSISVGWVSWITTNSDLDARTAVRSLKYLMDSIEQVATELGYTILMTATDRDGLTRYFKRDGWIQNHTGMTQLFKELR